MTEIQALVHDVFGTVVDWRGAVTTDGEALAARNGIGGVDWQQFADEWRGLYAPSMNKVRTGELAWTNLDALHRMALDQLLEKFGIEAVRGSGGRDNARHLDKGGAKALIALKKSLTAGKNVAMIADIPHGTPRDAGLGIVLLARLSGRPLLPVAIATSRRKVLEKSWDKTTINLPFGRSAVTIGAPIFVAADADDAEMERKRQEITTALNAATAEAYRLVDGRR